MNKNILLIGAMAMSIVALVTGFVVIGMVGDYQSDLEELVELKGVTNYDILDVTDGYRVDGTTVIDGDGNVDAPITTTTFTASGASTMGGDLTITTTNTATSTIEVGCVQMYATNTVTALHLEFNEQATTTLNGASDGSVAWKYGACPI